jgi:hypothetical protein
MSTAETLATLVAHPGNPGSPGKPRQPGQPGMPVPTFRRDPFRTGGRTGRSLHPEALSSTLRQTGQNRSSRAPPVRPRALERAAVPGELRADVRNSAAARAAATPSAGEPPMARPAILTPPAAVAAGRLVRARSVRLTCGGDGLSVRRTAARPVFGPALAGPRSLGRLIYTIFPRDLAPMGGSDG